MKKIILSLIAVVAFFIAPAQKTASSTYIKGSGSIGYIPKFDASKKIGNSIIYTASGGVSIGSTNITSVFSVYSPYSIISRMFSSASGTRGALAIEGDVGGSVNFSTPSTGIAEFGGSSTTGAFIHANSTYIGLSVNNGGGYQIIIKPTGVINMSYLPTSTVGLTTGDLWNDSGTLKIMP